MTDKVKRATLGQRLSDSIAQIVRSWAFVICQIVFIGVWMITSHFIPIDDHTFDVLRLILTIEGSFVGSILLMTQYRQSERDRKIVYTDYIMVNKIYREMKDIHPLIDDLHKKSQDRQS